MDNELTGATTVTVQVRGRTRVAPDTSRTLSYTWQSGITAGRFRVPVHVSYNRSNSSTTELLAEDEVWVIHPLLLAIGAVALSLMLVTLLQAQPAGAASLTTATWSVSNSQTGATSVT